MSDILFNGINRNGGTETATPNSASVLLNYRNDNGRLSEVGDKKYVGCVEDICTKHIWHHKLNANKNGFVRDGNNYVIGFYEDGDVGVRYGRIAIFDITAQYDRNINNVDTYAYKTHFLGEDENMFGIKLAERNTIHDQWNVYEKFYDIYTFNDLVVLETDKRRLFFYYNEDFNNFVQLPELNNISLSISDGGYEEYGFSHTPVNIPSIEIGEESFNNRNAYRAVLFPNQFSQCPFFDVNKAEQFGTTLPDSGFYVSNESHPAFRHFDDIKSAISTSLNMKETERKDKMLKSKNVMKRFRVVAVVTLADDSILNVSNVVNYFDYDRHDDSTSTSINQRGTVVDYGEAKISAYHALLGGHTEQKKNDYYNSFGVFQADADVYSSYIPDAPHSFYHFNDLVGKLKYRMYRDVIVSITSNLEGYKKWKELNIIKEISIYCTDILDLYDYNGIEIVSPPRFSWESNNAQTNPKHNVNLGDFLLNFALPLNNVEEVMSGQFYRIGEVKFTDTDAKLQIEGNMFSGITNKKNLSIDQILGKQYSSKNNFVYNGIVHKVGITSNVANNMSNVYKDNGFYLDVKTNSNGWIRYPIDASNIQTYNNNIYAIIQNSIELRNMSDIVKVNFVLHWLYDDTYRIVTEDVHIINNEYNNIGILVNLDSNTILTDILIDRHYTQFPYWKNKDFVYQYDYSYNVQIIPTENIERDIINARNKHLHRYDSATIYAMPIVSYSINTIDELGTKTEKNAIQLSMTDNPIVYPSSRNYTFDENNNIVIGCATTSQTLSDTKYGQLPLYVFTTCGVWVMEVGNNDIAYATSHKISNIECFNSKKMILGTPYGVVFMTKEGLILIDNSNSFVNISTHLEGFMDVKCANDIDSILHSHIAHVSESYEKFINFVNEDTFLVYDSMYKELLVINPNKVYSYVFSFVNKSWYMRCDNQTFLNEDGTLAQDIFQYERFVNINGIVHLVSQGVVDEQSQGATPQRLFDTFSRIEEHEYVKQGVGNVSSEHYVCSTPIFSTQYFKVEHLLSRFYNNSNNTHVYNIGMFIVGSRDGVEWKIVGKGILNGVNRTLNNTEIRRMICSCRYVQFVFAKIPVNLNRTNNRYGNYFSFFSFDSSISDSKNKLR